MCVIICNYMQVCNKVNNGVVMEMQISTPWFDSARPKVPMEEPHWILILRFHHRRTE